MEETHFWYEEGASDSDSESAPAPRLVGKDVYLRAVTPADYPFLQQIEMSSSVAPRWRFRGRTLSPADWAQAFWRDVLVQHMIVERRHDEAIGLAIAYRANFQDGYAYAAALRFGSQATPLMFFGLALFIDHVFSFWDLRKLYFETPEYNYSQFASGEGRWFEIEGRLQAHRFYGGRHWDELILAITRERWTEQGRPLARAQSAPRLRRVQVRLPSAGGLG
jgi:RimJ/RimL family protein N-acetyltransferase